jgi:hypothetical protein
MARTPDEDPFFALVDAWRARHPRTAPPPAPEVVDTCLACGGTDALVEAPSGAYCLCGSCHAVAVEEAARV